jgi:hypothetical protein
LSTAWPLIDALLETEPVNISGKRLKKLQKMKTEVIETEEQRRMREE